MPVIKIDGREYDTDHLSDDAKKQLASIQYVDRKINELKAETAAMQTARNAYAKVLSASLGHQDVAEQ